mmetsp:Transcript_128225/g.304474  ORF Transcript_128225/g.304474 Transcript_128225/m.304474 type:complete len:133 (-) Transcript_128225:321-719(-)
MAFATSYAKGCDTGHGLFHTTRGQQTLHSRQVVLSACLVKIMFLADFNAIQATSACPTSELQNSETAGRFPQSGFHRPTFGWRDEHRELILLGMFSYSAAPHPLRWSFMRLNDSSASLRAMAHALRVAFWGC